MPLRSWMSRWTWTSDKNCSVNQLKGKFLQNVVQRGFGMQPNTSGHSKSLRARARYGRKIRKRWQCRTKMRTKELWCQLFSFFVWDHTDLTCLNGYRYFWKWNTCKKKIILCGIFMNDSLHAISPKLRQRRKIHFNFFQDWGVELDRKLSWTTEKLFSEKFCCKLDTKTLLSHILAIFVTFVIIFFGILVLFVENQHCNACWIKMTLFIIYTISLLLIIYCSNV